MRSLGTLGVVALALAGAARAQDVVALRIARDDEVAAWAFDDTTGTVLAALPRDATLVELDPGNGDELRRIAGCPSERTATSIAVVARRVALANLREPSLRVMDLDTGQKAFDVALPGRPTCQVATAPDRPEPWVWLLTADERSPVLARVDLLTGAVVSHRLQDDWFSRNDHRSLCLSRDGALALLWGSRSTTVWVLGDEEPWVLALLQDDYPETRPGPLGRTWLAGDRIVALDLSPPLTGPRWHPSWTYHPRLDRALSLDGERARRGQRRTLGVWRPSTGDRLAALEFECAEAYGDLELHLDAARGRVLCGTDRAGVVAHLGDLLTGAPSLRVAASPPAARVEVGRPLSVRLTVHGEGGALALLDPPAGVSLAGATLAWTPTGAQVGRHRLRVAVTRGAERDELVVPVDVRLPAVDVGFDVGALHIDADGRRALASTLGSEASRRAGAGGRLAVVDLTTRAVTASRTLEAEATAVAFDGASVFVLSRKPPLITRLRAGDLAEDGRGFQQGLLDVAAVGSCLVGPLHIEGSHDAHLVVLDATTFQERWRLGPKMTIYDPRSVRPAAGGAAVFNAALVGPDGGLRALLSPPEKLAAVGHPGLREDDRRDQDRGRRFAHRSSPVAFALSSEQERHGATLKLELRDPATDARLASLPVVRTASAGPGQGPVAAAGDVAVVAAGSTLHVVPLPRDLLATLRRPVQVEPATTRPTVVRSDAGPLTIPLVARGGTGVLRFALAGDAPPGVALDAATGAVTVDPAAVWKEWLAADKERTFWDPNAARALLELVGADPTAFPLLLNVVVVARDAEQQRARCGVVVVIAGPTEEARAALDAATRAQLERTPRPGEQGPVVVDAGATLRAELDAMRRAGEAARADAGRSLAAAAQATEQVAVRGRALEALRADIAATRSAILAAPPAQATAPVVTRAAARPPADVQGPRASSSSRWALAALALAAAAFALGRGMR